MQRIYTESSLGTVIYIQSLLILTTRFHFIDHLGVCPGPKICGPPPCAGSQPKPDHWHCNTTSDDDSTRDESYATSGEEDVVTSYSAEVSDKSANLTNQQATSEKNMWMYVAGAAAFTAMVAAVAYRKRVS